MSSLSGLLKYDLKPHCKPMAIPHSEHLASSPKFYTIEKDIFKIANRTGFTENVLATIQMLVSRTLCSSKKTSKNWVKTGKVKCRSAWEYFRS